MRQNIYKAVEELLAAPFGARIRINNRYIIIKDRRTITDKPRTLTTADSPVLILTFRTPSGQTIFRYLPIMKKGVLQLCEELASQIRDVYQEFARRQYEMILYNQSFKIEKEFELKEYIFEKPKVITSIDELVNKVCEVKEIKV